MFATLTRAGGSPTILTLQAARKQLGPDTDILSVFAELGCGGTVNVTLADGTPAQLQLTEEKPEPELFEPQWPLQALRDSSLQQPFNAHCKVMLELTVDVQCLAIDEVHAEQLIESVFHGERPAPADFRVVFEAEETHGFMRRLRSVFETGELAKAGVADALVTGFSTPQRVLEYRP
jgi:hypothetical protein